MNSPETVKYEWFLSLVSYITKTEMGLLNFVHTASSWLWQQNQRKHGAGGAFWQAWFGAAPRTSVCGVLQRRFLRIVPLTWFWRHDLQASHPLAETRIVEVEKAAFQLRTLLYCQWPKLRESRLLQSIRDNGRWWSSGWTPVKSEYDINPVD